MKSLPIQIPTVDGYLSARLELPDTPYKAVALFAHCFTCGKDILAASRIAKKLASHGLAVLRFDFTGLGGSEGDFSNTNFSSNLEDITYAANWLKNNHQAPSLLIGHSLGGTAILAASDKLPDAKAIVTIGSPSDPFLILDLIGTDNVTQIEYQGEAEVVLEGRPFKIKKQFLVDARQQKVLHLVRKNDRPLMIMHSPGDKTVPIQHATNLYLAANHPKSFISLGDADHLVSDRVDSDFIADMIASWSARYIF
jgi:uncharacterized protein